MREFNIQKKRSKRFLASLGMTDKIGMTGEPGMTGKNELTGESGVALLIVISAILIITIVIVEMTFNAQIFNALTRNRLESLQATELSKTGIEMAILELNIYKQITDKLKGKDAIQKALRGQAKKLLNFGFLYPPPITEELSESMKSEFEELEKKSALRGSVKSKIADLGGRINLNNFAKSKELSDATRFLLNSLLNLETNKDPVAREKYRDVNVANIVNNIADYIDPDRNKTGGGEENLWYQRQTPSRFAKNLPLDVITELKLIEGIDENIYSLLVDKVTIYGEKININTAPKEILVALMPSIDEKELAELLKLREEQPFADQEDFEKYAKSTLRQDETFNTDPKIPLSGKSTIYSITSVAQVGRVTRKADVVVEQDKEIKILSWVYS